MSKFEQTDDTCTLFILLGLQAFGSICSYQHKTDSRGEFTRVLQRQDMVSMVHFMCEHGQHSPYGIHQVCKHR